MMKKLLLGVAIGALVGWFCTKRYYENEYEVLEQDEIEELEELKEEGARLLNRQDTIRQNKEKIMERKGPRVNVVENVRDLATPVEIQVDDEYIPDEEIQEEKRTDIALISEEDYDEEYDHHDKIELQYHVEENVLYDSNGEHELPLSTIGNEYINIIRDQKGPFLYVRDHKLEIDYLVERCSIHDNIPEYHSLAASYNEEKEKILKNKNGG